MLQDPILIKFRMSVMLVTDQDSSTATSESRVLFPETSTNHYDYVMPTILLPKNWTLIN